MFHTWAWVGAKSPEATGEAAGALVFVGATVAVGGTSVSVAAGVAEGAEVRVGLAVGVGGSGEAVGVAGGGVAVAGGAVSVAAAVGGAEVLVAAGPAQAASKPVNTNTVKDTNTWDGVRAAKTVKRRSSIQATIRSRRIIKDEG